MAIKFAEKIVAPTKGKSAPAFVIKEVDQFVALKEKIVKAKAKIAPLEKELGELAAALLAQADATVKPEEKTTLKGEHSYIEYGAKAKEVTAIDKAKLLEVLGEETYFALAEVKVGDVRQYCTPPQIAEILTEEQTGRRSVKVIPK